MSQIDSEFPDNIGVGKDKASSLGAICNQCLELSPNRFDLLVFIHSSTSLHKRVIQFFGPDSGIVSSNSVD